MYADCHALSGARIGDAILGEMIRQVVVAAGRAVAQVENFLLVDDALADEGQFVGGEFLLSEGRRQRGLVLQAVIAHHREHRHLAQAQRIEHR